MNGQIDILNVGEGHLEIRFEKNDVIEIERARRIIGDMLKRGYVLFVHGVDDALIRVKRFDATKDVYVIADGPTVPAETDPLPENDAPKTSRKGRERTLSIAKAKATVVGRSAGG